MRSRDRRLTVTFGLGLTLAAAATLFAAPGDWSQWRGPNRDGTSEDGPRLASAWPAAGLTRVWTSEYIPSTTTPYEHYRNLSEGGYSTPVVADGRVYQYYSWSIDGQWRDVFICLDAATGSTLWKKTFPSQPPSQWGNSSTLCVAGGRCYGVGNYDSMVYCLNAADGSEIWKTNVAQWFSGYEVDSSFLVVDGVAVLVGKVVVAFDAATGSVLWSGDSEFEPHHGYVASAAIWRKDGKSYVIASGCNQIVCMDLTTGALMWKKALSYRFSSPPGAEGFGNSSPTVSGDYVVVMANPDVGSGLYCYHMTTIGAELVWCAGLNDQGSSVAIRDGYVYVAANCGGEYKFNSAVAACYKLETGVVAWKVSLPCGDGASPVIVDGKFFATLNDGVSLLMAEATPDQFSELGRVTLSPRMLNFVTPVIANGKLFARTWNNIVCYDLLYVAPEATIVYDSVTADDTVGGNGNGLIDPGEHVKLWVTLANAGSNGTTAVTATLSCADSYVTVTDNQAAYGEMPGMGLKKQAADSFEILVASNCPTPRRVELSLAIYDGAGGNWTAPFTIKALTTCRIAGTVTLDGAPTGGVTVSHNSAGPLIGVCLTDAAGRYALDAVDGVYTVTARRVGWVDCPAIPVTVPSGSTNADFSFVTARVAGYVTDALTGNPLSGVTLSYTGALSGVVTSAIDGRYEIARVYGRSGTLVVTARKSGYFDSPTGSVTVPPEALAINFALEYADIDVTPASLDVSATNGEIVARSLTIRNLGTSNLTWSLNEDGRAIRSIMKNGCDDAIACDDNLMWRMWSSFPGSLTAYDAVTGVSTGYARFTRPSSTSWNGLDWDGTNLWVAEGLYTGNYNRLEPWILALDVSTTNIARSIRGPSDSYGLSGVAVGDGYIWVSGYIGAYPNRVGYVWKMNQTSGVVMGSWPVPAQIKPGYGGVEYSDGKIWIGGYEGPSTATVYKVYQLDAANGQLLSSFSVANYISDLDLPGSRTMWTINSTAINLIDVNKEVWLRDNPTVGTVAGLSDTTVAVTLDTAAAGLGRHDGTIYIRSNDLNKPEVQVPVTFTVTSGGTTSTYAVVYDGNGATGGSVPAIQTKTQDVAVVVSGNSGNLAKTGYLFAGWNTAPDGAGTDYAPGASYAANASVTLYANWVGEATVAPTISSVAALYGTAGAAYRYEVAATGSPMPTVAVSGLPGWLSKSGNTISGTPSSEGTYGPITVTASNGVNPVAMQTYSIVVTGMNSNEWAQWRGPNRDGVAAGPFRVRCWPPKLLWSKTIEKGESSVAISDGRLYTMGRSYVDHLNRVYCLDALSGEELWVGLYGGGLGTYGPMATPTVAADEVYTYDDTGILCCFNRLTGDLRWSASVNLGAPGYGHSSSPMVEGDLVVVSSGGSGAAVSRTTGAVVWPASASGVGGYASAVGLTAGSQRMFLVNCENKIKAVNPANGAVLWTYEYAGTDSASDPVVVGDKILLFENGLAVLRAGAGGVTEEVPRNTGVRGSAYTTPVAMGTYAYALQGADLVRINLTNGAIDWRLAVGSGDGGIAAAGGYIVALAGGQLRLVKTGAGGFDEEGREPVAVTEDESDLFDCIWTPPAVCGGRVYCRVGSTLKCYQVSDRCGIDADGNGIDDAWEMAYFGVTNHEAAWYAGRDSDGDGMRDLAEYVAGTVPVDPTSALSVGIPGRAVGNQFVLSWSSEADRRYSVLCSTNLIDGFTLILRTNIPSTPPENVHTDSVGIAGQRFYRVKVE